MTATPMTPETLARWCAAHQDQDAADRLLAAFDGCPMATQMAVMGYVLAEIDRQAPEPGLTLPALAVMVRRCTEALDLFHRSAGSA